MWRQLKVTLRFDWDYVDEYRDRLSFPLNLVEVLGWRNACTALFGFQGTLRWTKTNSAAQGQRLDYCGAAPNGTVAAQRR